MNQIENKYPVHIKCNLLKLDEDLKSPTITALLAQGYKISATIPVDDDGTPTAIIILTHQKTVNIDLTFKNIKTLVSLAVLAQSILFIILKFI